MIKKALSILLTLLVFTGSGSYASAEPKLGANSAILIDKNTGQILYQKEAFAERHPASLTKIMTGILALEYGDLNDVVAITPRSANVNVGQTIKLKSGEKLRLEDLIYAALIYSANDAAVAIAEHVGGSEGAFLRMMNQKALALGAVDTHFVNPNGYTKPNQRTTAYDLALIARYAMSNPKFAEIVKTKVKTISKIGKGSLQIKNTNKLLTMYPGCIGLKTGTTGPAGGCLAAVAKKDNHELIAIVLKSGDRKRFQDCIELFEFGFNETVEIKLLAKNELWEELFIIDGRPQKLRVLVEKDLILRLNKEQLPMLEKNLFLQRKPVLPIEKGERIGQLKIQLANEEVASVNLVAGNKVIKKTFWNKFFP